jgi:membrane protease YdiL (CAAX protease family)
LTGPARIEGLRAWARLLIGLVATFLLLNGVASHLGSVRGEAGVFVALLVIVALILVERWFFGVSLRAAPGVIGLRAPEKRGMLVALALAAALAALFLVVAAFDGQETPLAAGWLLLLPGLFAQAGIAEEALFRGFLFGHVYAGRRFWPAALLSLVPFAAAHLLLFLAFPWPVALASVLLAIALSPPLAHLYVIGGNTIWGPALIHFVAQGALKIVTLPDEGAMLLTLGWIGVVAVVPYAVFLIPRLDEPKAASEAARPG